MCGVPFHFNGQRRRAAERETVSDRGDTFWGSADDHPLTPAERPISVDARSARVTT